MFTPAVAKQRFGNDVTVAKMTHAEIKQFKMRRFLYGPRRIKENDDWFFPELLVSILPL
jgi:hypothetical protein